METIDMLLNEMESLILKARKVTFSSSDIAVNRQVMLDLLTRFRASYPIALAEAEQIRKDRDDILSKAEAYANKTMDTAEARAREILSESEITRRAKEEADAIREEAKKNYTKLDYEARSLAFNLLDSIEKQYNENLKLIADRKRRLIDG